MNEKCVNYYQVDETWFTNLQQIEYCLRSDSKYDWIIEQIQNTLDHGYNLFDGTLYEFLYNPMIYESSSQTVSIHRTQEGAKKAMQEHKDLVKAEFDNQWNNPDDPIEMIVDMKWDDDQSWSVRKVKIEE